MDNNNSQNITITTNYINTLDTILNKANEICSNVVSNLNKLHLNKHKVIAYSNQITSLGNGNENKNKAIQIFAKLTFELNEIYNVYKICKTDIIKINNIINVARSIRDTFALHYHLETETIKNQFNISNDYKENININNITVEDRNQEPNGDLVLEICSKVAYLESINTNMQNNSTNIRNLINEVVNFRNNSASHIRNMDINLMQQAGNNNQAQ